MRNLLIFLLVLVGIWWVRRALARLQGRGDGSTRAEGEAGRGEPERMIGCARCGLHVPESEAVREGDAFYCSEEHRRLGVER